MNQSDLFADAPPRPERSYQQARSAAEQMRVVRGRGRRRALAHEVFEHLQQMIDLQRKLDMQTMLEAQHMQDESQSRGSSASRSRPQ